VCLEALLKVGGDPYITLRGDGKASKKIDILHPLAPERCCIPTYRGGKKMACHQKLWVSERTEKDSPPSFVKTSGNPPKPWRRRRLRGTPLALETPERRVVEPIGIEPTTS
jgi:hypothetical protein